MWVGGAKNYESHIRFLLMKHYCRPDKQVMTLLKIDVADVPYYEIGLCKS